MLPFGQLDGGHITYAMFGNKQKKVARYVWWAVVIVGFGSILQLLHDLFLVDYPNGTFQFFKDLLLPFLIWLKSVIPWYFAGWGGWIFWALITRLFIKLKHPDMSPGEKLDSNRMLIGWISLVILLLSFSFNGIYFIE